MNREQAEKLLAALIFDDLDEPSKAELLAYLQTDDDLRERLADMRMAIKLARDAVNEGPEPALSKGRLAELKRLSQPQKGGSRVLVRRRFLAVAAVLVVGTVLIGLFAPSLSRVRAPAVAEIAPFSSQTNRSSSASSTTSSRGRENVARRSDRTAGDMDGYGGGMMGGMGGMPSDAAVADSSSMPVFEDRKFGGPIVATGEGIVNGVVSSPSPERSPDSKPMQMSGRSSLEVATKTPSMVSSYDVGKQLRDTEGTQLNSLSERPAQPPGQTAVGQDAQYGHNVPYGWSGRVTSARPSVASQPQTSMVDTDGDSAGPAGTVLQKDSGGEWNRRAPVLGDMPLDGRLFGSELKAVPDSDRKEKTEEYYYRNKRLAGVPSPPTTVGDEFSVMAREEAGVVSPESSVKLDAALPSLESRFTTVPVNPWVMTDSDPLSTFALDVDTASYALCRRYIHSGFLPPVGAVRMEEFINAFDYAYPQRDGATFAVYAEGAPSPFAPAGRDLTLLKIAVKARTVGRDQRRAAHIVFVVDASASMGQADRLPQVQAALNLLVDKLSDGDRVSLVTCANEARLHLEAISAREKDTIRRTIDAIQPAGPTNLLAGLQVGYAMARRAFAAGQINQVVLCSDGVANVRQTEAQAVLDAVSNDRKQGITLTCVGVGYGAYNDAFLEALADHGDGRYVFLDSSEQAREDLVGQLAATMQTVARDARIQVQFDPARVRRYRLIGYENRDIEDKRFRDDTVDAGEVGSGQCSTALYELELTTPAPSEGDGNLGTVFVRYRNDETSQFEEISRPLAGSIVQRRSIEENPRFFLAAGVARFAEWLRQSEHAKDTKLSDVQSVLDRVSAALPLDQAVRDLSVLAHQAEHLPRASGTTSL